MKKLAFVYVIGGDGGTNKVGYSKSPTSRLSCLRSSSGRALRIMHLSEIGRDLVVQAERYSHWLLTDHRVWGEWFDVSDEQARSAVIEAVDAVNRGLRVPRATAALVRLSFVLPSADVEDLEFLRDAFARDNRRETALRCIAIAKLAMDNQREDGTITLVGRDGVERTVVLNA